MTGKYDSKAGTLEHMRKVSDNLLLIARQLAERATVHDKSKLEAPEKELFDEMTPKLKGMTYGSEEYKEALKKLKPALDHHYKHNSHHPEHFEHGIAEMTLVDLVEMFCDWLAAVERHSDGCIHESIKINKDRFKIPPELCDIFGQTALKTFGKYRMLKQRVRK